MLTCNESRDLDPAYANTVYSGYSMVYTWEEVDQSGYFVARKIMLHTIGPPVEGTEVLQPYFSSDGRLVVYTHEDNIYKIPTDGGTPTQLTDTGHGWCPHWGWANDKIVLQRVNSGNFEDIFVMNSDGTDVQPLVSTRSYGYRPSWSPDFVGDLRCAYLWKLRHPVSTWCRDTRVPCAARSSGREQIRIVIGHPRFSNSVTIGRDTRVPPDNGHGYQAEQRHNRVHIGNPA